MARASTPPQDTSIARYEAKRDFTATREPRPAAVKPAGTGGKPSGAPMFVVQKHQAQRAGLHWDFRLEHNGVLWSWAVRKGPSQDPADKRIAVHVEDHPLDYADFQGSIPAGSYGAGEVETWDRGTWRALIDPDAGLRDGEIKFVLSGSRLHGKFTLVRLKPRPNERGRQDNWLLIKGRDEDAEEGADAAVLETAHPLPSRAKKAQQKRSRENTEKESSRGNRAKPSSRGENVKQPPDGGEAPPAPPSGARRGKLPKTHAPALAAVADEAPGETGWLSEIKFDGYRLLAFVEDGTVRLITRNGKDWTARLPAVAAAGRRLGLQTALLDGELVALDAEGHSSFPALQAALADGHDERLYYFVFDLLHWEGWNLRAVPLLDRKNFLRGLDHWQGTLRYSDHHEGDTARMRQAACRMRLEGIICKRIDAPYTSGRTRDWLKVKCHGREEFVVLGWTEPAGSRTGLGSLHLGYYDPDGLLHYVGGCGSGFDEDMLNLLRERLEHLASTPPASLIIAGEPLERTIHWIRPELVAETSFTGWTGFGRIRHAVFLGLRDDKDAADVVRPVADPTADHHAVRPRPYSGPVRAKAPVPSMPSSKPPVQKPAATPTRIVTAKAPGSRSEVIEGITLTHPDRDLWPGISKRDLVSYWQAVAAWALPGLAHRPLAVLRCPEGVAGEHFFQKHAHGAMPAGVREGSADKAPYLAIDGLQGLVALAQMSAVELHVWGASEAEPLRADQLVFDLDPGEGVKVPAIVAAALDLRGKLEAIGLASFCRTSGGKGLHVVVPLVPEADWDAVRPFCRQFAEAVSAAAPDKYLAHVKIADRHGRILIDWLRNGLGSTAVASFCPRARPGAGVATPLAWKEVTPKLDLTAFTLRSVPERLKKLKADPWDGFEAARRTLPALSQSPTPEVRRRPAGKATIVTAKPPKRR